MWCSGSLAAPTKWQRAREVRRRMADWEFIEKQPPKIRAALKLYVEKGDPRVASKLAGMGLDEFMDLAKKANIPSGP